jgi:hypothetical protein
MAEATCGTCLTQANQVSAIGVATATPASRRRNITSIFAATGTPPHLRRTITLDGAGDRCRHRDFLDQFVTAAALTAHHGRRLNRPSTLIWHHVAMPDDHHPLMPRRNPEDIDLGAIKADLEFLIEQVTRFRKEQALKPLYTMVGSAAIVIAWIELFWRNCL